jgi:hypothetical protein
MCSCVSNPFFVVLHCATPTRDRGAGTSACARCGCMISPAMRLGHLDICKQGHVKAGTFLRQGCCGSLRTAPCSALSQTHAGPRPQPPEVHTPGARTQLRTQCAWYTCWRCCAARSWCRLQVGSACRMAMTNRLTNGPRHECISSSSSNELRCVVSAVAQASFVAQLMQSVTVAQQPYGMDPFTAHACVES